MDVIEGPALSTLTETELRRLQAALRKAYRSEGNVLAVGLGAKTVEGVLESTPRLSARFHVKRKYSQRSRLATIPEFLEVRIRREHGSKYVLVRIPRDVIRADVFAPTAVPVAVPEDFACSGLMFRLRKKGTTATHVSNFIWGVLSVGHFLSSIPNNPIAVALASRPGFGNLPVNGQVRFRTRPLAKDDVSAIEVLHDQAKTAGYLESASGISLTMRSHSRLTQDAADHVLGNSLRPARTRAPALNSTQFRVTDFHDEFEVPLLGKLQNVIRVEATFNEDGLFEPGSSGSPLLVQSQIAALQVAGRVSDFRVGLGQTVAHLISKWLLDSYSSEANSPLIKSVF